MVAFPVAYTWSRDSATTLAWIVCGQTGWKPGRCSSLRKLKDSSTKAVCPLQTQMECDCSCF